MLEEELVAEWLLRFGAVTARGYLSDLRDVRRWAAGQGLGLLDLRRPDLQRYVRHLDAERGLAPATSARRLVAATGLLRYAFEEGWLDRDPTIGLARPKVPSTSTKNLMLSPADLPRLLRAAAAESPRAAALCSLLLLTGLRAGEALAVDVEHLRRLPDRTVLDVRRKGGNLAIIPLPDHTVSALVSYLGHRDHGPVFLSRTGRRLQRNAAAALLRRVASACLAPAVADRLTLHAIRHCYAGACAALGIPALDLQRALGHASGRHVALYIETYELGRQHPNLVLGRSLIATASAATVSLASVRPGGLPV